MIKLLEIEDYKRIIDELDEITINKRTKIEGTPFSKNIIEEIKIERVGDIENKYWSVQNYHGYYYCKKSDSFVGYISTFKEHIGNAFFEFEEAWRIALMIEKEGGCKSYSKNRGLRF